MDVEVKHRLSRVRTNVGEHVHPGGAQLVSEKVPGGRDGRSNRRQHVRGCEKIGDVRAGHDERVSVFRGSMSKNAIAASSA